MIKDDIDMILDEFDFEKAHKVMEFLDWNWQNKVPTIGDMRRIARQLLNEAAEGNIMAIGTGGFQVRKRVEEDKTFLTLEFVVTAWDNYE
jgi:hypothetical protein